MGPCVDLAHQVQKWGHDGGVKRQRRRQLHEYRPSFLGQAVGLGQKRDKWFSRVLQLQFMCNRPGHLDGEPKIRRGAVTPLRVGGGGVRPVKRRIDLSATERARVALEMRSCRSNRNAAARGIDQPAVPIRTSAVLLIGFSYPIDRQLRRPAVRRLSSAVAMGHWDHGSVAEPLRARFAPGLPLSRGLHHGRVMSASSSKRSPMSRLRTSRCAASSRGGEWRSSASRTIGQQRAASSVPVAVARQDCPLVRRRSDAFAMALINEYRPGTPIGWHRDAPQYDIVAGISLLSACRMKFRPYRSPFGADVASPVGDTRDCAGPSIGVPDDAGIATGIRTSHSAGGTVALLGDVSNAPLMTRGQARRRPGDHVLTPCEVQ